MTGLARRAALRVWHALGGHHRRYVLVDRRRHPIVCFGCRARLLLPGDLPERPTPHLLMVRDQAREAAAAKARRDAR